MSSLLDKLAEFAAAGIQHLWVVDPGHALLFEYVGRGLAEVEAIEFPDRGFRLAAQEIFG